MAINGLLCIFISVYLQSILELRFQSLVIGLWKYVLKFLLNKSHITKYRIYCYILKWRHLKTHISIIDTSIYVSKFLLNKSHISEYGIYCSMLFICHLITHISIIDTSIINKNSTFIHQVPRHQVPGLGEGLSVGVCEAEGRLLPGAPLRAQGALKI